MVDLHQGALGMKALVRYEGFEWSPEDGMHATPHSDEHHEHEGH